MESMKIPIYDSEQGWLGAIPIKITDAGSGQQRITVRVPQLKVFVDIMRPQPVRRPHQPAMRPTAAKRAPAAGRASQPAEPPRAPTPTPVSRGLEISFVIPAIPRLPSVAQLGRHLKVVPRKRLLAGAILGVIIVALPLAHHFLITPHATGASDITLHNGRPVLIKGNPAFATILPAGKNIANYGGWTRISPPDRAPVYGYTDKIGNVPIDVSEQALPANFQIDTASAVQKLAENFGATNQLTAGQTAVYVGTSINGPQSVIFTKNGLLVLVKSVSPIADAAWVTYINTLR